MKLKSIFDSEVDIEKRLQGLVPSEQFYSMESIRGFNAEYFRSCKDTQAVIVIELMGYYPPDGKEVNSRRVMLSPEWRINVITPSELYNSLAGTMLVEIMKRMITPNTDCGDTFQLISDKHQFHQPDWDNSLVMLHATFTRPDFISA